MKISVKRVYDPLGKNDGMRVLADRLWPRGITKKAARIDIWAKDLAPSNSLRAWYHKDSDRFTEFRKKYRAELSTKKNLARELFGTVKSVTLITSVKDISHSHIPELVRFLEKL